MEAKKKKTEESVHVMMVPFPGEGHLNPMLQFSRRLVSKGLKVTFVVTRFILNSNPHLLTSPPNPLQFDSISDGFDEGGFRQAAASMPDYLSKLHTIGPQTLADLITKYQISSNPIHCVIYQPFCAWALDVAKKFGLLAAAFFTHPCAVDYIFHRFIRREFSPDSSAPVTIKGLPELEVHDLPSFIAFPDAYPDNLKMVISQFSNLEKADYILTNSFYQLESEVIDEMLNECPNMLTIGPTVPSFYLDKRIENNDDYGIHNRHKSNTSIHYSPWLNTKPARSVVYVAFGSMLKNISKTQFEEIAQALNRTGFYFLWVVRDSEEENLPEGFMESVADKGFVVNWCSQVKVLSNEAIGCFLTHCGWNSIMEALSLGVPMVTFPHWSDQPTNAKFVQDVWKVGIRPKISGDGVVKREEIEFCIREVMTGEKGEEMRKNAMKWKELAVEAISEGGTSDTNISQLVSKLVETVNAM